MLLIQCSVEITLGVWKNQNESITESSKIRDEKLLVPTVLLKFQQTLIELF